ncbi:alpha/beta hydrolase [Pseudonocardia sp. KRD-184]|uniref:Alpha/beta hydrolase n=1 Tax=Pseudonocardia oceani TaxID=2792013 RepID=A0ABS6UB67_9PSEU|nr:alpha/beta hydrolase [Pseudonocardia oceani]MBW0091667.1 alpha/beta hydrolase [Pseudonocardia oceani]MBW0094588.1 alpha/beta hydrolase [Pseudonocardia oceani]MBW0107978.1 alpha/beta hydrolase [Pseudonocardia oceani]MBW0119922.1 alpha/beta hydrolase [Pseudonocardia oceani]MBW0129485.1 alpha/beta hydrolase [Pseudonocardia oceani]
MTAARLGAGRHVRSEPLPEATRTSLYELGTADGATVTGTLRTVPGATTVVCIMHPRQDQTHHPLVPILLRGGAAVWTQVSRSVNNDIALVHEQTLLDVAAGLGHLRDLGFDHVVTLGHSGGGTLYAYYHQQAGLDPAQRVALTPAGRPSGLPDADLPPTDAAIFLAPHPGQGRLLLACIDASVADEGDPLSRIPELDPYDPANGFADPPTSARYSPEFLRRYRAAQHDRVARIDAVARERVADAAAARARGKATGDLRDRRAALAPRLITVYRTDADPRTVDLSLDPNERPYGSLFGRRPDLINHGLVGFGRLTTPDAWLSTWSGLSTNADFVRCAPGVTAPTLFVELTGDQAAFPSDSHAMLTALGSTDLTAARVRGTHFGGPVEEGATPGSLLAGRQILTWLDKRFALACHRAS